jgi:orotidine-5'-phosphate decarboxylase
LDQERKPKGGYLIIALDEQKETAPFLFCKLMIAACGFCVTH